MFYDPFHYIFSLICISISKCYSSHQARIYWLQIFHTIYIEITRDSNIQMNYLIWKVYSNYMALYAQYKTTHTHDKPPNQPFLWCVCWDVWKLTENYIRMKIISQAMIAQVARTVLIAAKDWLMMMMIVMMMMLVDQNANAARHICKAFMRNSQIISPTIFRFTHNFRVSELA